MDPLDPSRPLEFYGELQVSRKRDTVQEDVRRFGDFDEITETQQTIHAIDGRVEQIDTRQIVFRLKRNPEEAETVQANLDPDRIRRLIVD